MNCAAGRGIISGIARVTCPILVVAVAVVLLHVAWRVPLCNPHALTEYVDTRDKGVEVLRSCFPSNALLTLSGQGAGSSAASPPIAVGARPVLKPLLVVLEHAIVPTHHLPSPSHPLFLSRPWSTPSRSTSQSSPIVGRKKGKMLTGQRPPALCRWRMPPFASSIHRLPRPSLSKVSDFERLVRCSSNA